jgi:hypothetical protein
MADYRFPISVQIPLPPDNPALPAPVRRYLQQVQGSMAMVVQNIVYWLGRLAGRSYGMTTLTFTGQTAPLPFPLGIDANGNPRAVAHINGAPQMYSATSPPGVGFWSTDGVSAFFGTPLLASDIAGFLWAESA